jgi:predicted AlkP superfamily phosphohydrolase/phosphomutase/tetratricopeptide (TPR) repeat protein
MKKKFIIIGWDGADWRVIKPLLDQGLMPTLKDLMARGAWGNLATLDPPLSPMLWTSIATGMTADQHGVLGFVEPMPEGKGIRPVLGSSRKTKAVWNILMQEGYKTHVVGWWPSHPAEPVDGVYVSNFYHKATNEYGQPWPLAPGSVHPERMQDILAQLRVHPAEITAAHILPFVPKAADVDQEKDKRLGSLAKILADTASVHAAATWAMENEPWDFMGVYYDAVDHFGHGFMNFHSPQRPGIPDKIYELYNGVVTAGYRFHDMMLARTLELAGPDTTVMLISDHGFHPDHLRPRGLPKEPAGPAHQHRELGIIVLAGPDIVPGERVYGANLLDIAPTVLTHFDLPMARDMGGRPLIEVYRNPPEVGVIDSWEDVPGECGMHPPEKRRDTWGEQAMMDQLIALGYIDPPGEKAQENIEKMARESQFYLARVHLSIHHPDKALPILEKIYPQAPDETRYALRLANCYRELNKPAEAKTVVEAIIAQQEKDVPGLDALKASILLDEDKTEAALPLLERATQNDPRNPGVHLRIAGAYFKLEKWFQADESYNAALKLDPDNARAYLGLAVTYLRQNRPEEAVDAALAAIDRQYFMPAAHFYLGQALRRMKQWQHATQAFQVAIQQAPGMRRAHLALAKLYENRLGQPDHAAEHRRFAEENIVEDKG